ncbi:MAG: hypothetical protein WC483_02650 [Candidatus Paceibacterota bacterium]|jgi:uncharacterized membrane protein
MTRHRRKKSINLFWIILLMILGFLVYFVFKNKDNFFKKDINQPTSTTTTLNSLPISFETKNIIKDENTYSININYPYFKINFIDKSINDFINEQINSFVNDFGSNKIFNDNKNTLDIVFDPYLISND